MSSGSTGSQAAETRNGGNNRTPCPLYGCQRVYADASALESHIKDHEISAESVPGKVLLCSSVGCSGSFPNMQKLMEHMRHHHKPNLFFQCESCRTKLRSYRGLLTHLHTCSKVPRGKTKPSEPMAPPPAAVTNSNVTPMAVDRNPPRLDSGSTPQQQQPSQIPNPDGSFPGAVPQPDSTAPPLPPPFWAPQPQLRNEASDLPPSPNLDRPTAAPDPPDAHGPKQTQSSPPEAAHPAPGSAPSAPGSSAVWKKSQGAGCSRRILWEHTRGCYTCVQCGHKSTNRKEMTQHIKTQHSGNKAAEDTGAAADT